MNMEKLKQIVYLQEFILLNEEEIEVSLDSEVKYIEIFNIPDTEVRMVDIIMFFEEKKKFLV